MSSLPSDIKEASVVDANDHKEKLTGPRLVRATNAFAKPDVAKSRWLLFQVLVLIVVCHAGIFLGPVWLKFVLSTFVGVVYIRLFIFYHDFVHGAQLTEAWWTRLIMRSVGYLLLSTESVWKETHDYHHRYNARVIGSGIGSYPVVTVAMWNKMSPNQRRAYLALRHPMTILFGYITVFMLGMSIVPFIRQPKRHFQALLAVIVHVGAIVAIGMTMGWLQAFLTVVMPLIVAMTLGSYLFYAQHNFPDVEYFERRSWEFDRAAIESSSMFDMPCWLHWLTGNIGYHHIHHLNHRIPFYRLPEAYEAIPELRESGRTSWRPSELRACLSLAVWDPAQGRMITYKELRALAPSASR